MRISRHLMAITPGGSLAREYTLAPGAQLGTAWVVAKLAALGFEVRRDLGPAAMVRIVATKT
jgi:hypothetical protein